MRKTNCCLRGLFIGFNVFFAVIGCILTIGTIQATAYSDQISSVSPQALVWLWLVCIAILAVACLGIYAGFSEKMLPLKIFAGFMGVGLIIMFILGIVMAVGKSNITSTLKNLTPKQLELIMSEREITETVNELQHTAYCCGVLSPEDWGTEIPDSCSCTFSGPELGDFFGTSSCRPKPIGHDGPDTIYDRPCRDVILIAINFFFKLIMAFFFTLAFISLISLVMSVFMIKQVKRAEVGVPIPMKTY